MSGGARQEKEGDRSGQSDAVSDVFVIPIKEPWNEVQGTDKICFGWIPGGAHLILFRNLYKERRKIVSTSR